MGLGVVKGLWVWGGGRSYDFVTIDCEMGRRDVGGWIAWLEWHGMAWRVYYSIVGEWIRYILYICALLCLVLFGLSRRG